MEKISHVEKGKQGENLAETYLVAQGYKILGRNLTSKFGEIDLVIQKQQELCFVEIKSRHDQSYGPAILAITPNKQKRIRKTAEYLLLKNPDWRKLIPFFSVLTIEADEDGEQKIEFIKDAFV